jgi:energy-coupling factor transporter ATP-binding protein EcfA2
MKCHEDGCVDMKFALLSIRNFKAIRHLELTDLQNFVVVAGPNGCGKSSIFDAIRLLKSVYSGRLNKFSSFLSEMQINQQREGDVLRLFRDDTQPIEVWATIMLSEEERQILGNECEKLLKRILWSTILRREIGEEEGLITPDYQRTYGEEVQTKADEVATKIREELLGTEFKTSVLLPPGGTIQAGHLGESTVVELFWQIYEPNRLGIIDYHGPDRHYPRENIENMSIQLFRPGVQVGRTALYHPQQKYQHIKSELTVAYLRDLLRKEAQEGQRESVTIMESLRDMFDRFFAGKQFVGPVPDREGRLQFRVTLETGQSHDIDDLSSGEKELIYGYLRVRSRAPRNSVLLLDELELHLNPRLMRGLAHFLQEHLGLQSNNQLWIATHSDALLREVWGSADCSSFHIRLPDAEPISGPQGISIAGESDLDRAILDLAGPATFDPMAKVVFFEGRKDQSFDVEMVKTLFPEFEKHATLVPLGSKTKVHRIQAALREADRHARLDRKLYSVVDKDFDEERLPESHVGVFHWGVYEIENFLLEPKVYSPGVQEADDS